MTPKGRGRGRRSRGRRSKKNKHSSRFDPTKHWVPEPPPKREYEPCPLSGEKIEDILTAVADPNTGRPCNFRSVIEHIRERENVGGDERVCYIGEGTFAIVKDEKQGGKTKLSIQKRIEFEDKYATYDWRKELSPGISRDYVPNPTPLSELYTAEEIRNFEFGHGTPHSIYLPKND